MLDGFSATDTRKDVGLFINVIGRNEHRYRLTDRFLIRITKEPLCAFVPRGYNTLKVFADDSIVRKFDDRSKPSGRLFRTLAISDIEGGADDVAAAIERRANRPAV